MVHGEEWYTSQVSSLYKDLKVLVCPINFSAKKRVEVSRSVLRTFQEVECRKAYTKQTGVDGVGATARHGTAPESHLTPDFRVGSHLG